MSRNLGLHPVWAGPRFLALRSTHTGRHCAHPHAQALPVVFRPVRRGFGRSHNPGARGQRAQGAARARALSQPRRARASRQLRLPGGRTLVRFAQVHAGLPVLARGPARCSTRRQPTPLAAAKVEERFPSVSKPGVSPAAAAQAAELASRGAVFDAKDAALAWFPGPRKSGWRGSVSRLVPARRARPSSPSMRKAEPRSCGSTRRASIAKPPCTSRIRSRRRRRRPSRSSRCRPQPRSSRASGFSR